MADFPAFAPDLMKTSGAKIICIHRHGRRAFGAPVSLQGPDAKALFKGIGDAVRQFFRTHGHEADAAELFG